jgi:hypothetical protein
MVKLVLTLVTVTRSPLGPTVSCRIVLVVPGENPAGPGEKPGGSGVSIGGAGLGPPGC